MQIHLHKQATTTPRVRAAIQASDEPGPVLAERFGVTPQTIYKWRKRDSVHDRSHTPHRLQTTLTPAQEAVAVALRKTLLVSLDDLLVDIIYFGRRLWRTLTVYRRHAPGNARSLTDGAATAWMVVMIPAAISSKSSDHGFADRLLVGLLAIKNR